MAWSIFAWAYACVLGPLVSAESPRSANTDERDRWTFSGAYEVGLFGHSADANFSGSPLVGPRATNIGAADDGFDVVPNESDSKDVLSALIGVNFEVMAPSFRNVLSQPRLFLDVGLLSVVAAKTSVARIGDPDEFALPRGLPFSLPFTGELIVIGRGTEVTAEHQAPQLHIGLGTAFTFDFDRERIRIKPSIVYSRIETRISAVARRAVRILNADPTVNGRRVRSLDSFRLISLSDQFTEVYHGIGPALEIEYDTPQRIGSFVISLFVKAHATHLFGDLETNFEAANPDQPLEIVRWRYKNDRWVYRATTGVRLRWLPE